jgi:cytochrome c553
MRGTVPTRRRCRGSSGELKREWPGDPADHQTAGSLLRNDDLTAPTPCRLFRSSAVVALVATGVVLAQPAAAQGQLGTPEVRDTTAAPDPDGGRRIALSGRGCEEGATGLSCYPCAECHGETGAGFPENGYPRLAGQSYLYLYEALKAFAEGRRADPVMQEVARTLDDQAMRNVSAYYTLVEPDTATRAEAAQALSDPEAEALVQGGVLAAVGDQSRGIQACANCHGPDGAGLAPTYPYLAGQYAAYLEDQLRAWKSGARKADPLNVMQDIAERLTDAEIRAVAKYYAAIRPSDPVARYVPNVAAVLQDEEETR